MEEADSCFEKIRTAVAKMAKLLEMVRNSPITKRRMGGYSLLEAESKDPFVRGINFHAHFVSSGPVKGKHDNPQCQEIVKTAWEEVQKSGKPLRKVVITVKANSLRVKDVSSKETSDYPIYLVSYCGASTEVDFLFFFIQKSKVDKTLHVEIFKFSNASKVTAATLTVAKAFNIAFKAWMAEKKRKERENSNYRGSESPLLPRKQLGAAKEANNLTKMAPAVAKTAGPYTPPATRRPPHEAIKPRQRSGSFGDSPDSAAQNPAIMRVRAENEVTGSTHDVTITDEFDKEFRQLAEGHPQPDILNTNLGEKPDSFDLLQIQQHTDPGSVEDLTAVEEPED